MCGRVREGMAFASQKEKFAPMLQESFNRNLKKTCGCRTNPHCARLSIQSGRSAVWLARFVRDEEVGGSNPLGPTIELMRA